MYKVWIGNRESEILTYNIFNESITYFGSNSHKNSAYITIRRTPASYSKDFLNFVIENINRIIEQHSDAEFHIYNPMFAYKIFRVRYDLKDYFKCINNYETLKWLTSKTFVREWLSKSVTVPPYALLSKKECFLKKLQSIFGDYTSFVVQKDVSGGGQGTFLLNIDSEENVQMQISDNSLYLVSPYLSPKISACCHILIDSDKTIIFPFGIQSSELVNNKVLYMGTSYNGTGFFNSKTICKLNETAQSVGERMRNMGYLGICGLDFLIHNDKVFFIEVNVRYLGSSFLINKALKEHQLPSLFDMNNMCFYSSLNEDVLQDFYINYTSKYETSQKAMSQDEINTFINDLENERHLTKFYDGLKNAEYVEKGTYLCREILLTE